METESLLESMGISFSVKWEENGVKPYGIPEASPRKLFRVSFKRKNPQAGEMKTLTLRYYGLVEPDEKTIILTMQIKKPKDYEAWLHGYNFEKSEHSRRAHVQIVNDNSRILSFFSREGEIKKMEEFYLEEAPFKRFKKLQKNPSIVLSLEPLIRVPRIPIEELNLSRLLKNDLAIKIPKCPFFLILEHMEEAPWRYRVSVWRTLNKNLIVNKQGNLSQYKFYEEQNLVAGQAIEKAREIIRILCQDFNAIFKELETETGAFTSFVPFTLQYGYVVWKAPSPDMPEVSEEILDKVEAKCNEVFQFLLKGIRVIEDSEKGEKRFKFYLK